MKFRRFNALIAACSVMALYLFAGWLGITCPIKFVTGVSCPGCGMTRAWFSLLRGDITGAFYFHPLVLFPIAFIILWYFKDRIGKKTKIVLITVAVIAFFLVYFIRMFALEDTIVVFSPKDGIIYKGISFLMQK